jgi:hypothetical protein
MHFLHPPWILNVRSNSFFFNWYPGNIRLWSSLPSSSSSSIVPAEGADAPFRCKLVGGGGAPHPSPLNFIVSLSAWIHVFGLSDAFACLFLALGQTNFIWLLAPGTERQRRNSSCLYVLCFSSPVYKNLRWLRAMFRKTYLWTDILSNLGK